MTPTLSVVVVVVSVPFAVAVEVVVVVVGEVSPFATAIKSVLAQMMPKNDFMEGLDDATERMFSDFS
jgi:hypothetical protein